MSGKQEDILKKPLYVFDLPQELLSNLHFKATPVETTNDLDHAAKPLPDDEHSHDAAKANPSTSCLLCDASSSSVSEQRLHVRSDWHNYNLKQKIRGSKAVTEDEFEKLVGNLNESLSGSDSGSDESDADGEPGKEDTLDLLLRKQARIKDPLEDTDQPFAPVKKKRGSGQPPLLWFSSPLLPTNTSLGIYRALMGGGGALQDEQDVVEILRKKQLQPVPTKPPKADSLDGVPLPSTMTSPSIFMCMVGGGHFAGMVVSLAPKLAKQSLGVEQRQAIVLAHKTFHRYTTRRKQGGGQSANDSAKGAAHSAGSSLRRYNEVALEQEIRSLLSEWKGMIEKAELIFVRATGSQNRRVLFGPYDDQILHHNDPRNRTFPFSTRRATQAELMRAFVELTRVKVSHVDEAALAAAAAASEAASKAPKTPAPATKPTTPQLTPEEEAALLHTSQIQALIRRSRVPALLAYLTNNSLSPHYPFHPPSEKANHHAPTPLHLAASTNSPAIVNALLLKAHADPTITNAGGQMAFSLAGDRATRDAFRTARHELGEERWDWEASHVPPGLNPAEAAERAAEEKQGAEKAEAERRKAEEERLKREGPKVLEGLGRGRGVKEIRKTAEEKREEEGRGMSEEVKKRMERERRARAAEARFGKLAG